MIRYRLQCANSHEFEAWFRSSADYDAQAGAGQVLCPDCDSGHVSKAIMAPNVAGRADEHEGGAPEIGAQAPLMDLVRDTIRTFLAKAENVGTDFPEEARKIHYQEAETRRIYGEASREEARALLEEGIEILALPALPEDAN